VKTWIMVGLMVLSFSGCYDQNKSNAVEEDSIKKNEKKDVKYLLVDVRSQGEYEGGHIQGCVHIPHTQISTEIVKHAANKNQQIFLY